MTSKLIENALPVRESKSTMYPQRFVSTLVWASIGLCSCASQPDDEVSGHSADPVKSDVKSGLHLDAAVPLPVPTNAQGDLSREQLVEMAREAIRGKLEIAPNADVIVTKNDKYDIVSFLSMLPPQTMGPNASAKVYIDSFTKKVDYVVRGE